MKKQLLLMIWLNIARQSSQTLTLSLSMRFWTNLLSFKGDGTIKPILSVNELNLLLKTTIDDALVFQDVYVTGELSNLVFNKSGHVYFSLKDETSTIGCMM